MRGLIALTSACRKGYAVSSFVFVDVSKTAAITDPSAVDFQ